MGLCGTFSAGPDGNSPTCPWCVIQLPDAQAPCGAALWGIQATPGEDVAASGYFTNNQAQASAPATGWLAFRINDDWYTYDVGNVQVTVTTQ